MNICHECRIKLGYKRKDKGSHTARLWKCDECKNDRPILAERHWIKANTSK